MEYFIYACLVLFVIINVLAWKQSGGMVKIASFGKRTSKPENLSKFQKFLVLIKGVNLPCKPNEGDPLTHGLQYEKHQYKGSQGQLESWYIPRAGSTKVVLLFHGYVRNKSTLLNEAVLFHKLGYSCLMVDFPGSGDSLGSHTSIGYNESTDVLSSLNYARKTWPQKSQILYGFSMGAAAILRAAKLEYLEVEKIILESPFTTLLETVGARFQAMGIPPYPLAHLLVFWGSIRLGYNGFTYNPIKYAKDLKSPVLQMHGTLDRRVPLVRALELHQNIRVDKTFVAFEGCGHESLATKEPEKWRTTVDNFLNDADQAPLRKAS